MSVEKPVKIQMPASLRKQLVDDWESVTQHNKVMYTRETSNHLSICLAVIETASCWHLTNCGNDSGSC